MIYRIKQFFWAITAKITEEEKVFIQQHLTKKEQDLFNQLKVYEKKHSIVLAKMMKAKSKANQKQEMIRLALLHDIGKTKYPIGPIRKSMMVLLHKFSKGRVAKWRSLKMVRCYYEHAEIGYNLLKDRGSYNESFLELIRDHHKCFNEADKEELILLRDCDSNC